jgi:RNA polymerase sigma factor (sigma-70 family)
MATAPVDTLLRQIQRLAAGRGAPPCTDRQLLEDFAARRDEAAFAALVERHGGMVLRVCRRVLRHEQDAEDAFQATFLVLARNAGSIRRRDTVGGWLYGVAYRTALKARRGAARRRDHEAQRPAVARPAADNPSWDEVQAVLDEEVRRLPEPVRQAFVLCVLEGRSGAEAAAELGCREGAVKTRVHRARRALQQQLARRGIQLAALLAALAVAERSGRASVPGPLARATVRFGLLVAAGEPAAGVIPTHVAALAAGVTRAMFLRKAKIVTVVVLAAALVAGGAGVLAQQAAGKRPVENPKSEVQGAKPPAAPAKDNRATVSGRVVGPDGKPVAGAKLFLCDAAGKSAAPQPAADGDGRFHFALPAGTGPGLRGLLATADGLGLDWAFLQPGAIGHELTLHLPADVPIAGKVVTTEGKPVAGAAVRIVELSTTASGTLDEFLKQWAADRERKPTGPAFHLLTEKRLGSPAALRQLASATTGPDGTFRLTGIGRDRGLMLGIRGPGITDQYLRVVTRPGFVAGPGGQVALQGPEPTVVVAPGKSIRGTLRDARTKQPLAGVRVLVYTPDRPIDWWWQPVKTVTDAQGRYRLDGLAKARQIIAFDPGPGATHMHRFDEVADTAGFAPIVHDAELYRGVVVSGRVTDRSTGRPVRARIVYCPLLNNGNYSTTPGYAVPRTRLTLWVDSREMDTGADGRYRLTALPGPGALFVRATEGRFMPPTVPKKDRDPAIYHAEAQTFLTLGMGDIFPMSHIHAYRLIRPAADATELTADVALDPGVRRRGRLLDVDGREVAGARAINLAPPSAWKVVLPGAEFTAEALNPAKPRRLLFWHEKRKLAGTVVLRGDEPEPVTVTLRPLGTITGRAVRKNGEPLVGYSVEYSAWPVLEWPGQSKDFERRPILTDKEGRFRVLDLPAGVPLRLSVINRKSRYGVVQRTDIVLEPGKTRDLGTLRGQTEDEP